MSDSVGKKQPSSQPKATPKHATNGAAPNGKHAALIADPHTTLMQLMQQYAGVIPAVCLQKNRLSRPDFPDNRQGIVFTAAIDAANHLKALAAPSDIHIHLDDWAEGVSDVSIANAITEAQNYFRYDLPKLEIPDKTAVPLALECAEAIREHAASTRASKGTERDAASTREGKPRFELFTLRDMIAMPRPLWLVRGLLVEKIASFITADSGSYKSFFALDMALCVALGRPFMGRDVKQGAAVYVAAEGFYTIPERAQAFALHHNCELPENFHALKVPVNLGDPVTVAAFADAVADLAPALVVLDTLSQCAIGANENDNAQMADFVRGMMALCERIGAHVAVLHHNAKSTGAFRGAGAIKANADAHISLEKPEGDEENTVFVRCEKQRGEEFKPFALRGTKVVLPFTDEYGDAVTSLVFEPCGDEVAAKAEKHPSSTRADKTRDALLEVFDRCAIEGAQFGGVKIGFWKEAVDETVPKICEERTFWKYRKQFEADGTIEPCGIHNQSPVFRRKNAVSLSTASTASTAKCSECSRPNNAASEYCKYCNNPLGVAVLAVPSAVSANAVNALPEMPARKSPKKKNPNADSEAYAAPKAAPDESEVF